MTDQERRHYNDEINMELHHMIALVAERVGLPEDDSRMENLEGLRNDLADAIEELLTG